MLGLAFRSENAYRSLPGIADFLRREHMTLDIVLDEQNYTYALLEQGAAVAGVSSEPNAMRF